MKIDNQYTIFIKGDKVRKREKEQIQKFIELLLRVHLEMMSQIGKIRFEILYSMFLDCVEGTECIISKLEKSEGDVADVMQLINTYHEQMYELGDLLQEEAIEKAIEQNKFVIETVEKLLTSIEQNIKAYKEVVFLPYKASMWDSLESIWMAAEKDVDCRAYVVPIPYYERNSDYSLGTYHYEGNEFPEDVPITYYEDYSLDDRQPDVIYIHNPYDGANYVTSVEPRFYSDKLKTYTDCLVYVPYYATSGGMSEGQEKCPAYYHVDYIVIQAEKYRKFFDKNIQDEKFLPFGSPKFDRVIRMCNQPKQIPKEWKEKMEGKKVYFFNTSLSGLLADTDAFLKKMDYVFQCFEGREDTCILWRPHPLFESTLESMREGFVARYQALKQKFLTEQIGIYDDTPDITKTIALCDAYIGDGGTSLTSLFGVAGKPIFLLDNMIHQEPQVDDWRIKTIKGINAYADNDWMITQGNKLYHKKENIYRYCCDLNEYSGGDYFSYAITMKEKTYICPANAQEIVVVQNEQIVKRIQLKKHVEQMGAFYGAIAIGKYIFLIPYRYPAIARLDTDTQEVIYIKGYEDFFVKNVQGEWRQGAYCKWKEYLLIFSPKHSQGLAFHSKTGKIEYLSVNTKSETGYVMAVSDKTDIWLLPFEGTTIVQWNPENGKVREFSNMPENFYCRQMPYGMICNLKPFFWSVFYKEYVYISPLWGNMFLKLNQVTGEIKEWEVPVSILEREKSGYYNYYSNMFLVESANFLGEGKVLLFSGYKNHLYEIDLETKEYKESAINFDMEELKMHEVGFSEISDWMQYGCEESAFYSLHDFLNGQNIGNPFDKNWQLNAYQKIIANIDGRCGEKTHHWILNLI